MFGRSLGSGVAVQLAAVRPVIGVILVAPFDSLVEVGKRHYPFLPVNWLLKHRFDSAAHAPKMKTCFCVSSPPKMRSSRPSTLSASTMCGAGRSNGSASKARATTAPTTRRTIGPVSRDS